MILILFNTETFVRKKFHKCSRNYIDRHNRIRRRSIDIIMRSRQKIIFT